MFNKLKNFLSQKQNHNLGKRKIDLADFTVKK